MDKVLRHDALLGPAAPDLGWVPAPRYLLRRARVMRLLKTAPRGRLLEIGPGAASLMIEATQLGFDCEALELSESARDIARKLIARFGANIPVYADYSALLGKRFDLLCAFDVLEHIEDDRSALENWRSLLKAGGTLLLSVPAHMRLWSAGDEWAGHYRRYERDQLRELLRASNFSVEHFECYGFPAANLSERFSAPIYARRIHRGDGSTDEDRRRNNDRSGIDRAPHLKLYPLLRSPIGRLALGVCYALQNVFAGFDLGSGYLVAARVTS